MSDKFLNKPVALVTGSGRGIGRGIALKLAADGFHVVINSVSADPTKTETGAYEVKATIEKAGGSASVFKADVSSATDRAAMLDFVKTELGRLDLLVNNAGIAPRERRDLLEATEESFDELIRVNLRGPYFLTQAAANFMIGLQKAGKIPAARICFVSSISAYTASINRGEYCVSKAGIAMAVSLFADRLAEFNIPVIEIRPGVIATDMTSGVKGKYDNLIAGGLLPTKRWGEPEDVAKLVSAFGRGDLDYSTGVAIDVSGGFNLRRL